MRFRFYNHVLIAGIVLMLSVAAYWVFLRGDGGSKDYPDPPLVCESCAHSWDVAPADLRRLHHARRHAGAVSDSPAGAATNAVTLQCPSCRRSLDAFVSVFCPRTQRRFVLGRASKTAATEGEAQALSKQRLLELSPFAD